MNKSNFKQANTNHSDFRYAAQICICLLKPVGAWPLDEQASLLETILHRLSIVIVTLLQFLMLVPWFIYIITANISFYDVLRTACPLIYCTTIFLRYLLLLFHRDDIKSCIDRVADDWRNVVMAKDRKIMLANAKSGRLFGMISVGCMFTSGIPYCIVPLASGPIIIENVTIKLLPNPYKLLIFDDQVSPVYEIVYVWEFVTCCIMYIIFCGICSLTAKLVTHVCGQCDILVCLFEELIEGGYRNQDDNIDERIRIIIRHHLRIIKFVSDMDKMLNEICLAEFVNASCNICLLGYYVIMDWNNQESKFQAVVYCFAFISITFNIYIFCYIGELLVNRCQKVGTACYMIEWYRLPYQKARSLLLPIIIASYPLELTAGKMLTMTMSSFSNILKSSMAYFNLLREVSVREIM